MRVSSFQAYDQNIQNLNSAGAKQLEVQNKISTGQNIDSAGDDPAAFVRTLQLEANQVVSEQYQRNIDLAEARNQVIESNMSSIEDVLFRVRELVISAGNATFGTTELQGLQSELIGRTEELADLLNAKDVDGKYLYAGFSGEQPFVQVDNGYQFHGDDGVRLVEVTQGSYVQITESGGEIFTDIPVVDDRLIFSSMPTNSSMVDTSSARVSDSALYADLNNEAFAVRFGNVGNVAPPGPNYQITRRSDGAVLQGTTAYDPAVGISFSGVDIELNGTPNAGDEYLYQPTENADLLTTIESIANNLLSITSSSVDSETYIGEALNNIDNIVERLLQKRVELGARLNKIESTRGNLEAQQLSNTEVLSDIRDLDYNEAISNLTFLNFVLEASRASFSRISGLSLFNFLR